MWTFIDSSLNYLYDLDNELYIKLCMDIAFYCYDLHRYKLLVYLDSLALNIISVLVMV